MKELFEIEPELGGYERNGPEPSLRSLIFNYYCEYCSPGDALEFTDQYISEILRKV